jgi:hypothetical protein
MMIDEKVSTNGHLKALSDDHYHRLHVGSAISDDVIRARGAYTITTAQEATALGFTTQQAHTVTPEYPALIIPYYNPDGTVATYIMRPDNPRSIDNKKKRKLADGT